MKIRTPLSAAGARDVAEAQLIHIRERSRMRERFYFFLSCRFCLFRGARAGRNKQECYKVELDIDAFSQWTQLDRGSLMPPEGVRAKLAHLNPSPRLVDPLK